MMYSFPTISTEGSSTSIWNSAGLASTTATNPNLPDLPSLASQYQNYSGFSGAVNDDVIAAISTEEDDEEDDDFENTIPQLSNLLSEAMAESQESVDNLQSVAAAGGANSLESSPVAPVASPFVADPVPVPAVSPTHAPKDPGYYSESECSSNSSEKDTLAGTFSKTLKMDPAKSFIPLKMDSTNQFIPLKMDSTNPFAPLSPMAAITKPVALPEAIPFLASPVMAEFTENPPIPSLPRFDPQSFDQQSFDPQSFDPQSFDPQDLGLSTDESWKVIKKPGEQPSMAEAAIVPDLSCAESVWGSEGGSWSGASSPLGQWGAELGKLGFGQSTRQQVGVLSI